MVGSRRAVFVLLVSCAFLYLVVNYHFILSLTNNSYIDDDYPQALPISTTRVCKHMDCDCNLQFTDSKVACLNQSATLTHFNHHLCPQNFKNIADFVFDVDGLYNEKLEMSNHALLDESSTCKDGLIIYVRGGMVDSFFKEVYPQIVFRFVLVTGAHVASVPSETGAHFLTQANSKIIHWYGQNPSKLTVAIRDRFTPIPLGLNCFEHSNALDSIAMKVLGGDSVPTGSYNPIVRFPVHEINSSRLVLANFNPKTHESREPLWKLICDDGAWKEFAVCKSKNSGVHVPTLAGILTKNMDFPFWLSPRGKGLDCHRNWEALYLGRIPIIMSSPIDYLFEDLPVLIVNSWEEVTQESLLRIYSEIQERNRIHGYDYSRITLHFWTTKIISSSRHSHITEGRPARCWAPR